MAKTLLTKNNIDPSHICPKHLDDPQDFKETIIRTRESKGELPERAVSCCRNRIIEPWQTLNIQLDDDVQPELKWNKSKPSWEIVARLKNKIHRPFTV